MKITAISGSTTSNVTMSVNVDSPVKWYNIEKDSSGFVGANASYKVEKLTKLRGTINLNFKVAATSPGNGAPQFFLDILPTGSSLPASTTNLVEINQYMQSVVIANTATVNTTYNIPTRFNTVALPAGTYQFALRYTTYNSPHIQVVLDPGDAPKSYLSVTEVCQAADFKTLNMAANMPYGTNGIKCIDFIKGLQRKFNLMIYPSKTVPNQFIVETFNNWYKTGQIKNFDNYINLNEKIEVVPANNLAVNKLEFGDKLDTDYVSQQFYKGANREYGKTYYIDTNNFFSQGEFKVETTFASSPLLLVPGSGISGSNGSSDIITGTNSIYIEDTFYSSQPITCLFTSYVNRTNRTQVSLLDSNGNTIINTGFPINVNVSYTYRGCNGFGNTYRQTITIPNGASSGYYDYDALNYVDCGQGSCGEETIPLQCVNSITGQSLPINSLSPFNTIC